MSTFFVELGQGAKMPNKSNTDDAGFDLYYAGEKTNLFPKEINVFNTGVKIALSPGWEAQIRSRSGMASKKGIVVLNSPGTIDAGYRGEIKVILHNCSSESVVLYPGDRIAQMVIKEVPGVELKQGVVSSDTERKEGGFGSTGR